MEWGLWHGGERRRCCDARLMVVVVVVVTVDIYFGGVFFFLLLLFNLFLPFLTPLSSSSYRTTHHSLLTSFFQVKLACARTDGTEAQKLSADKAFQVLIHVAMRVIKRWIMSRMSTRKRRL